MGALFFIPHGGLWSAYVNYSNFSGRLLCTLQNLLDLFNRVSGKDCLAALRALQAGDVFNDNDAISELYRVDSRVRLHFAFADKTSHFNL